MKDWMIGLWVSFLALLAPIQGTLICVGFLILADMITGIIKARKIGERINSRRLVDTINKVILYNIAIGTGLVIEYLIGDTIPAIKLIAIGIAVVECLSILENIEAVTGLNLGKLTDLLKRKK